jgi:ATP-dependent DNA helicase RecG
MPITQQQFEEWLLKKEKENLEFKEAKNQYDYKTMMKYCCAIANEGGGYFILGVHDKVPRQVVGTHAFPNYQDIKKDLFDVFHLRFEIEEYFHQGNRALVFTIPSRPIGAPLAYEGRHWMRINESLEYMTPDHLKKIFNETQPDFSAQICNGANLSDLNPDAVGNLRKMWSRKTQNHSLLTCPIEQLLEDAELLVNGKLNYAALILLGTIDALNKNLPNSEIVFEYRNIANSIQSNQRVDLRNGFLAIQDKLWTLINARNDVEHLSDGLFIRDIPYFNEEVIREALLNAVTHRDYNLQGSVFIRQSPKILEIENPGGFPAGVTPQNIIYRQNPRNRRIAEVLQKCGLVERSGQGADKIFRFSIEESKPLPDYSHSDSFSVLLKLKADIQDVQFLKYFEKISEEKKIEWAVSDLLIIDQIRRGEKVENTYQSAIQRLKEQGFIELVGHGRGTKYILSKRFYSFLGKKGTYTRQKGLDFDSKKALLLKHIENHEKGYFHDFKGVFPELTDGQIKSLLRALKEEGKVFFEGSKKGGFWILVKS